MAAAAAAWARAEELFAHSDSDEPTAEEPAGEERPVAGRDQVRAELLGEATLISNRP